MEDIVKNSKKCFKCQLEKEHSQFHKCRRNKDGYQDSCKACKYNYGKEDLKKNKEKHNDRQRKWKNANMDRHLESRRNWYERNKNEVNLRQRKHYENNKENIRKKNRENYWENVDENRIKQRVSAKRNIVKRREYKRKYTKENKDKVNLSRRNYRKNNPEKFEQYYRDPKNNVDARMSANIRQSLKGNKNGRSWESLVGYDNNKLRKHLESQFTDDMNWESFSKGNIAIDHIVCKELFVYDSPEDKQFKACWELKNLQPMWSKDNFNKSDILLDGRHARFLTRDEKLMYLIKLGYDFDDAEDQIYD